LALNKKAPRGTSHLKDLKGLLDHPDPKYRLYCISLRRPRRVRTIVLNVEIPKLLEKGKRKEREERRKRDTRFGSQ
jgi:hypothetical protein